MSERTKAENKAAMAEHLIGQYEARAASELAAPHGSELERIESRVADLGDSEAADCIREVCKELRKCRLALGRIEHMAEPGYPPMPIGRLAAIASIARETLEPNAGGEGPPP